MNDNRSPVAKQFSENQLGSTVSSISGVWGKAAAANAFWCILSSKIAPSSDIFGYSS